MSDRKWYAIHDNLVGLAEWLDSECSYFSIVADCICFFSKPWKWNREYDLWRMWLVAEGDSQKREEIVVAALENRSAEELMAEWEEEKA